MVSYRGATPLVIGGAFSGDGERGRPHILIFAGDLQPVATLVPGSDGTPTCSETCPEGAVAVDRGRNRLHVVWNEVIWTFDLLPAQWEDIPDGVASHQSSGLDCGR